MTIMFIAGGVVLGLLVFLLFRRKWNKAEKKIELKDKVLICLRCKAASEAFNAWKRSGLRGDLFSCMHCGQRVWNPELMEAPKA